MIRYSLKCGEGHGFEGWFSSATDYDSQSEKGLLACPQCGNGDISKSLMTPNVAPSKKGIVQSGERIPDAQTHIAAPSEEIQKAISKIRELRKAVLKNTEDVGDRFSEVAREIHYGEADARGIRGRTDLEEAAKLVDEGIEILPIPTLPEDKN